jgi:hypothetical protein
MLNKCVMKYQTRICLEEQREHEYSHDSHPQRQEKSELPDKGAGVMKMIAQEAGTHLSLY